jgi:hypothetical protein
VHHAVEAADFDLGRVYGELRALAFGRLARRGDERKLTVADLTGLGSRTP